MTQGNDVRKLGIIGLGYIGLPTAAMFAATGLEVVGIDIDPRVRESVNSGVAHIEEGDLDALVSRVVAAGTLRAVVDERLAGRRLPVLLMTAFGALALVLASVGVYAMFASMAAAREREFGVRVALGSTRGGIAALVLRQGGAWMVLGLAGGGVGVVIVGRLVSDLLYGVAPFDPLALGVAGVTLLLCAAAALLVPIRRATRVDPITVVR